LPLVRVKHRILFHARGVRKNIRVNRERGHADDLDDLDFPASYRRVCQHLALAQRRGYSVVLIDRLQDLVHRGHLVLYRPRSPRLQAVVQFFAATRCRRTGVVAKVFWIHLMVLPASAAIGIIAGALTPPGALGLAPVAVAVTVGGYVLGFVFQFAALARSSAAVAGIAFCAEPVVAALASAAMLGERLTALQLVGCALVLAAILTNVVAEQRRARAPE